MLRISGLARYRLVVTVMFLGSLLLPAISEAARKTGVLIFPIKARGLKLSVDSLDELQSYLGTRLTIEGVYQVMPEERIQKDLGSAKLKSYKDCYDESCRIELGKAVSADKSVSVSITGTSGRCRITAMLYDLAQEMSEAAADHATGCDLEELRSGMAVIAAQLSGRVAPSMQPGVVKQSTVKAPKDNPAWPVLSKGSDFSVKKISRTKIEWFALRVNGGGYGGGAEISLFTLRWKYVFWEIIRGGGMGVGPGLGGGPGNAGWAAYGGTAFGVPVFLDSASRHELRFQTGLFGGAIQQDLDNAPESDGNSNTSVGPFVLIEASYLYHATSYLSVQVGLEAMVPTLAVDGDMPDASLNVFFGFRI